MWGRSGCPPSAPRTPPRRHPAASEPAQALPTRGAPAAAPAPSLEAPAFRPRRASRARVRAPS
eukprot:scaffold14178_cov97-Isochrysis_galbana.AAC.3